MLRAHKNLEDQNDKRIEMEAYMKGFDWQDFLSNLTDKIWRCGPSGCRNNKFFAHKSRNKLNSKQKFQVLIIPLEGSNLSKNALVFHN